ncbi:hypothetical protein FRC19_009811 [Serendipita sp. 401]|nr:hypothetical protein FRC19_009811 [Serendipita sp. 401]
MHASVLLAVGYFAVFTNCIGAICCFLCGNGPDNPMVHAKPSFDLPQQISKVVQNLPNFSHQPPKSRVGLLVGRNNYYVVSIALFSLLAEFLVYAYLLETRFLIKSIVLIFSLTTLVGLMLFWVESAIYIANRAESVDTVLVH